MKLVNYRQKKTHWIQKYYVYPKTK